MTSPAPTKPGIMAALSGGRITRALLFVTVLAALLGLFILGDLSGLVDVAPGQRSPRTVISNIDFDFEDQTATAAAREEAAATVPTVWRSNLDGIANSWRRISRLLDRLNLKTVEDAVERWNESSRYALTVEEARPLAAFAVKRSNVEAAHRLLDSIVNATIIADRAEVEAVLGDQHNQMAVEPGERTVHVEDVLTPADALQLFESQLLTAVPVAGSCRAAWRQLAADALQFNVRFDRDETQRRKAAARESVQPKRRVISHGQTIVYQGQEVTEQAVDTLRAYKAELNRVQPPEARRMELYGQALLVLVVLLACCGYLWSNHPQTLRDTRQLLLLVLLALLNLAVVKALMIFCSRTVLVPFAVAQFAIPMAVSPLLVGVLLQPSLGVFMTVFVSVFTAILAGNSFPMLITGLVSGFAGVYFTQQMRRRSRLIRAGVAITIAELLCIGSLAAMTQTHISSDTVLGQALAGLVNGVFTVFLASGLLPICEHLFSVTTDIRLLELSDLNHPLLKKLCLTAPGTYHHSLVVANLSESAAEAIDANPVLARVCAYYHDIGKVNQPEFFSENQTPGTNAHDRLAPTESFHIIAEHVRLGEEMARKHHLNPPIIDVIREHHGTTLVYSIFHKARQLAKEATEVVRPFSANQIAPAVTAPREEDFRYAGPKPQTRESAIISLADAVESAARSLRNPTPESVRALVKEIIVRRLQDGQLDQSDLTLHQLHIVAERFTSTLCNMLHTRVAYPKDESAAPANQPQQSPAPPADQQGKIA